SKDVYFEDADALDSTHRRECARKIAIGLATGMGGGVVPSPIAIGRLAQVELEDKTRFVAAKSRGVLGRALVTAGETGGRDVSRLAIRAADAVKEPRSLFDRDTHDGPRNRRQHRDLQRRQRSPAQPASLLRA